MNIKPHEFKRATIDDIEVDLGFVENALDIVAERITEDLPEGKLHEWQDGLYTLIEYIHSHITSIRCAAACIFKDQKNGNT